MIGNRVYKKLIITIEDEMYQDQQDLPYFDEAGNEFVREINFAGGHIFTYSPRPGTGAARMKGQIKPELRKKRNHVLTDLLEESAKSYREEFVGQQMSVLWESTSEMGEWGWQMEGLTENYLRVQAFAPSPCWNELDEVQLQETSGDKLKGVILNRG